MSVALRDCALGTGFVMGVVVAAAVAVPLTFAVGVLSAPFLLVGGIPYLVYRNYKANKATEDLNRIGINILNDKNKIINGKSYLNPNSNFYTKGELESLQDCLVRIKGNLEVEVALAGGKKIVKLENKKLNKTQLWMKTLALALIPVIGLIMLVNMHITSRGGSFNYRSDRIDDHFRLPNGREIYNAEARALDLHIEKALPKVQRHEDVTRISLIMNRITKTNTASGAQKLILPIDLVRHTQTFLAERRLPKNPAPKPLILA